MQQLTDGLFRRLVGGFVKARSPPCLRQGRDRPSIRLAGVPSLDQPRVYERNQEVHAVISAGEAVVGDDSDDRIRIGGSGGFFDQAHLLIQFDECLAGLRAEGRMRVFCFVERAEVQGYKAGVLVHDSIDCSLRECRIMFQECAFRLSNGAKLLFHRVVQLRGGKRTQQLVVFRVPGSPVLGNVVADVALADA